MAISQLADTWSLAKGEVGSERKKVHITIWREYYWSLPSWKAAKVNGLVSGVDIVVWRV